MNGDLNLDFTDPQTLTRVLGIIIPILVGLISKKVASQGLKATLNALLSAISGSLVYLWTADGALHFGGFVNAVLNTFIVSIATYYGVWKPTGVAGTVADKTSTFGIGPKPVLETKDKGEESPPDAAGTPTSTDSDVPAAQPDVDPDAQGGALTLAPPTAAGIPIPVKKAPVKKAPAKKAAVKKAPPRLP